MKKEAKKPQKALCISIGGSKGAWSAGLLETLNNEYHVVAGSSTGAAMALKAVQGKYEQLSAIYTSLTQKKVYNVDPYNKKGKISKVNAMWRIFRNLWKDTTSIGEGKALQSLLFNLFSEQEFEAIKASGKEVVVGVQETLTNRPSVYYFNSKDHKYADFLNYVMASMSAPILLPPMYMPANPDSEDAPILEWTDAGLTEVLPLLSLLKAGHRDIDVIMHRPYPGENGGTPTEIYGYLKDQAHAAQRYMTIMRDYLEMLSLDQALDYARKIGAKVRIYWMPPQVKGDGMYFDNELMKDWHNIGKKYGAGRIETHNFSHDSIDIQGKVKEIMDDKQFVAQYINVNYSGSKIKDLKKLI